MFLFVWIPSHVMQKLSGDDENLKQRKVATEDKEVYFFMSEPR